MKNFILIPDSFKGTMSSETICRIMAEKIKKFVPDAKITSIPVADGGEGSVDCFLSAVGGTKKFAVVQGPFGEDTEGFYAILPDGETAVIEMACCAGLPLAEGRLDPLKATTYGVGQLMLAAIRDGVKNIILGLGGSATNDGACGLAAALWVRFINSEYGFFIPVGGSLKEIDQIDISQLHPEIKNIKITAMCDIDNPMFGSTGAAHIFAPQKGADEQTVKMLDDGLKHLNNVFIKEFGKDMSELHGGGAAGGMGAGVSALLNAELKMGIDTVLDTVSFDEKLKTADMIFTGEGKIDGQSLRGKVVIGVARRAQKTDTPVTAVVGSISDEADKAYDEGVTAIFSTNTRAVAFEKSRLFAEENLGIVMENIMRFMKAI